MISSRSILRLLLLASVGLIWKLAHDDSPPIPTSTTRDNFSFRIRRYLQEAPDNVFVAPEDLPLNNDRADFLTDCTVFLLSKPIVLDQSITNMEYAGYVAEYCTREVTACYGGVPLPISEVSFEFLNPNLREVFILAICPIDTPDAASCAADLKGVGDEFGLEASPATFSTINEKVKSLCDESYSIMTVEGIIDGNANLPVIAPIRVPVTPSPTPLLTPMPSLSPTIDPTVDSVNDATGERPVSNGRGSSRPKPTTPAVLGLISMVSAIAFCVAVVYSGGAKDMSYDLNGPSYDAAMMQEAEAADAKPESIDIGYNSDDPEKDSDEEGEESEAGDSMEAVDTSVPNGSTTAPHPP